MGRMKRLVTWTNRRGFPFSPAGAAVSVSWTAARTVSRAARAVSCSVIRPLMEGGGVRRANVEGTSHRA